MRRVGSTSCALAIGLAWIGAVAGPALAQPSGPHGNIPIPPAELEQRLTAEPFEIQKVKGAGAGVTGAKKLGLVFPADGFEVSIKWKPVPGGGDGWNNSPRRELAAYTIQKWFLDPDDYVVPTSVALCIPFESYTPVESKPSANVGAYPCVLGIASVWLDNVTVPDELHDENRFESDSRYAYHLSNMNLLAYLIKHQDGRTGNFLTSTDESDRRVFAVDNGISFGVTVHNFLVPNWHRLRVHEFARRSIERLRGVGPAQLDALGTVAELRADSEGILRNRPPSQNLRPGSGARIVADTVQLGLTDKEIGEVRERLSDLLEEVDEDALGRF